VDTDGDTLDDYYEVTTYYAHNFGYPTPHYTSPIAADTDSDGINDNVEITRGSSPVVDERPRGWVLVEDADFNKDNFIQGEELTLYFNWAFIPINFDTCLPAVILTIDGNQITDTCTQQFRSDYHILRNLAPGIHTVLISYAIKWENGNYVYGLNSCQFQ